jgi:hypothetical protein
LPPTLNDTLKTNLQNKVLDQSVANINFGRAYLHLQDIELVYKTFTIPNISNNFDTGHGILMHAPATIVNCIIQGFNGDGIHIAAEQPESCYIDSIYSYNGEYKPVMWHPFSDKVSPTLNRAFSFEQNDYNDPTKNKILVRAAIGTNKIALINNVSGIRFKANPPEPLGLNYKLVTTKTDGTVIEKVLTEELFTEPFEVNETTTVLQITGLENLYFKEIDIIANDNDKTVAINLHIYKAEYAYPRIGTNANEFRIMNTQVIGCGGHGVHTYGGDANAGLFLNVVCINNGGYGFYENSTLGNMYCGCHASGNGANSKYQGLNANYVMVDTNANIAALNNHNVVLNATAGQDGIIHNRGNWLWGSPVRNPLPAPNIASKFESYPVILNQPNEENPHAEFLQIVGGLSFINRKSNNEQANLSFPAGYGNGVLSFYINGPSPDEPDTNKLHSRYFLNYDSNNGNYAIESESTNYKALQLTSFYNKKLLLPGYPYLHRYYLGSENQKVLLAVSSNNPQQIFETIRDCLKIKNWHASPKN